MVLYGRDAEDFIKMIIANEHKKVGIIPTPKLKRAEELIRAELQIT